MAVSAGKLKDMARALITLYDVKNISNTYKRSGKDFTADLVEVLLEMAHEKEETPTA